MHARHHSRHHRDVPMGRASCDLGDGTEHPWLRKSIDPDTGCREFSMFGRLVLRLDPASCRCAWFWRDDESREPREMRLQPDLLAPLFDPTVMALFGDRLIQRSGDYERLKMPTMAACRQAMQIHIQRDPRLKSWQQDWHRTLSASQARVLTLAERARLDPRDGLSPALYELVWGHERLFLDLVNNAPQLCPLLAQMLASGRVAAGGNGILYEIRSVICELPDCRPATWRWLLQWGLDPLLPVLRAVAADREPCRAWEVTAAFLSLWSRGGLPPPLRQSLSREWARRMGSIGDLERTCPDRLRLVAEHVASLCSVDNEVHQIADVLERASTPLPSLDCQQKRAGWSWLHKECRKRSQAVPIDAETLNRIRHRLPSVISVAEFDLVVLRDEQAIAEEGRLMAQCMDLTPLHYLNDDQLHFSIRRKESGTRLATCSVKIGGCRAVLTEVLGPGNEAASKSERRAAEQLVRHPKLVNVLGEIL